MRKNKKEEEDGRGLYVLVDGRDNSVTLSRGLYSLLERKHLRQGKGKKAVALVFRAGEDYAFTVNPELPEGAQVQLCEVQYNPLYKQVGFETLCPTVNRIAYDYGVPYDRQVRLDVVPRKAGSTEYYAMLNPIKNGNDGTEED